MDRRLALACPSLLLAAALVTGCAGGGTDTASGGSPSSSSAPAGGPATGGASTPAGGGAPTDVPAFPADTSPDTAEASGDALVTVTGIRAGRQEGYDRVVFEVEGTGTPGWDVRYVDEAASQGSGEPVEVAGDAVLQVTLTGVGYPYDTGVEEWAGPDPLPGSGTTVVTEVAWDATFEGTSVAFVGASAQVPFRVYALEGPTRVVVELADPS
ncbi:AMIN-like domain-containing (lipo)protein [Geodermatophilus marinus]|uniref:AMIN-like domain-containing (lipo)protein n=1 Tax=Geodermatophilus sp. LHW52908 TaxID=2303986 RepID=UPI000E3BD6AD|nr:hypothetical protein [Geodermatophilus sp. LHW52908]RFU23204.1 hypothetical protein D0Z06_00690 [Geodermatophilus sp. LHW52908]